MNNFWNQLRPLEKRLVVGVSAVVFIVLNAWFVVPHFSDWGKVHKHADDARRKLADYNAMLAKTNELAREIRKIEGDVQDVPQEDQANHFASTIQSEMIKNGVALDNTGKIQSTTNQNFIELAQNYQVHGKEQQLVDFLYNLGAGNSLIRVRDLNLHPDQPRYMLGANIKFVGSYQARIPVRGAATSRSQPAPARSTSPTPPASTTSQPKSSTPPTTTSQQKKNPAPGPSAQPGPGPAGLSKPLVPAGRIGPTNISPRQAPPMLRPGMTNKSLDTKKS